MEQNDKTLWQIVKSYFNALPDKENEEETIRQISSGVVFHGANLWVLIFAIFIASLGLNTNSTAVIIGAMLISPLMGPIIGMGLSIGINDLELLKRSVKNYLVATVISVLTATIYFIITPLTEAQSELLARTSPTLYDVLIALCGGAAGILALSTKGKGNVIPGVAIATALMPPLCTAGYGLAVNNMSYFFGAFYLFFINTVFICLATFVGVRMLKFKPKKFIDKANMEKVKRYIITAVVITMLPATYMTIQIIRKSVYGNNARKFVKNELAFSGTQIISQELDGKDKKLNIVAVGKLISQETINKANHKLKAYKLDDYSLNIIQGTQSDSLLKRLNNVTLSKEAGNQKLLEQSGQINTLENKLLQYTRYENMGKEIGKEVKAIFPSVERISLSNVTESYTDTTIYKRYILAVAGGAKINASDKTKLQKWLKARTNADSLRLITTM
ncbi:TIGR00341 family protein [Xylanibacter muris]|uniref:TIGR00341 family protein n=1 Tax=Xylanibacter muris TaxID=2736290 RepID=A0ABX2ARJ9_9BACT|nr:TIGR00341 family protein [Xylanibacter muris]NPD93167.1 TIGR00341 family protein [Xylanibacter muris]